MISERFGKSIADLEGQINALTKVEGQQDSEMHEQKADKK